MDIAFTQIRHHAIAVIARRNVECQLSQRPALALERDRDVQAGTARIGEDGIIEVRRAADRFLRVDARDIRSSGKVREADASVDVWLNRTEWNDDLRTRAGKADVVGRHYVKKNPAADRIAEAA